MTQLQGKCLVNVVLENVGDNDNSQGNYCQEFCLFSRKLVRVMIIHKVTAVRVLIALKVSAIRVLIIIKITTGSVMLILKVTVVRVMIILKVTTV